MQQQKQIDASSSHYYVVCCSLQHADAARQPLASSIYRLEKVVVADDGAGVDDADVLRPVDSRVQQHRAAPAAQRRRQVLRRAQLQRAQRVGGGAEVEARGGAAGGARLGEVEQRVRGGGGGARVHRAVAILRRERARERARERGV